MSTYYAIEGALRVNIDAFEALLAHGIGQWMTFKHHEIESPHTDLLTVTVDTPTNKIDNTTLITIEADGASFRNLRGLDAAVIAANADGHVEGGFMIDTTDGTTARFAVIAVDGTTLVGGSDCLNESLVLGEPRIQTIKIGERTLALVNRSANSSGYCFTQVGKWLECSCVGWDEEDERGLCAVVDDGKDPGEHIQDHSPVKITKFVAAENTRPEAVLELLETLSERALAGINTKRANETDGDNPNSANSPITHVAEIIHDIAAQGRSEGRDLLERHLCAATSNNNTWSPGNEDGLAWIPDIENELYQHGTTRLGNGCLPIHTRGTSRVGVWTTTRIENNQDEEHRLGGPLTALGSARGLDRAMLETATDLIVNGTTPRDAVNAVRRIHNPTRT